MVWKKLRISLLILIPALSACTTTLSPFKPVVPIATNTPAMVEDLSNPPDPTATLEPVEITAAPENQEPTALPTLTWLKTATPAVLGLNDFSTNINPLTALPVEVVSNLDRRPVMIKVSNFPRSGRPHAGLSFADIVFEYYIGEEMNRFLAVFYSQNSPQVGPLRSGRLIDAQLTSMYGGILVYGGADPRVDTTILNVLQKRAFTHNSTPCPPICGSDTHSVSGVFVDSGSMTAYVIKKGVDNSRPVLFGLLFDQAVPKSEDDATDIGIEYSFRNRGEWHYDANRQAYLRWIEADDEYTMIPLVDRVNNQQLSFTNIIVLFVTYVEYNETLHDVLVWDNIDGNPAYIFRDGLMVEGTWKVPDHEQPIQLYNKYGLPLPLKPGNSWFVFMGQSSRVDRPKDGQWEIYFDLP